MPLILKKINKQIAWVTINRPEVLNAMNESVLTELVSTIQSCIDNTSVGVIILTGTGDKAFVAGADINNMQSMEPRDALEFGKTGQQMTLTIENSPKPVIAAVNGFAIGVGLGLALSCDIRIASDQAQFAEAFVRMGLIPGDGSTWQLPRMVGMSNTFLLQYTGDRVDAAEALRMNLVSKVYPHDRMLSSAIELAGRLASGATLSMSLTKYLVQKSMDLNLTDSLRLAQIAQEQARRSDDHKEAVRAFLDKRKPEFKGR